VIVAEGPATGGKEVSCRHLRLPMVQCMSKTTSSRFAQETLRRLAASLAATEASLAEEQANTRRLDDMLVAAERAAAATAQDIQVPATSMQGRTEQCWHCVCGRPGTPLAQAVFMAPSLTTNSLSHELCSDTRAPTCRAGRGGRCAGAPGRGGHGRQGRAAGRGRGRAAPRGRARARGRGRAAAACARADGGAAFVTLAVMVCVIARRPGAGLVVPVLLDMVRVQHYACPHALEQGNLQPSQMQQQC